MVYIILGILIMILPISAIVAYIGNDFDVDIDFLKGFGVTFIILTIIVTLTITAIWLMVIGAKTLG